MKKINNTKKIVYFSTPAYGHLMPEFPVIKRLVEKNLFEQNRLKEVENHSIINSDIIILKNKEKENLEMLLKNNSEEIKSLQEEFMAIGGYEVNSKVDKIISGFKVEH